MVKSFYWQFLLITELKVELAPREGCSDLSEGHWRQHISGTGPGGSAGPRGLLDPADFDPTRLTAPRRGSREPAGGPPGSSQPRVFSRTPVTRVLRSGSAACEAAGDEDVEPRLHDAWMFCSSSQRWWAPPPGSSGFPARPDVQHQCLTQDFSLLCH